MIRRTRPDVALVLVAIPLCAARPVCQTPQDVSASFAVPAGCQLSLWAESPLFYNPTAIDIDPQGRVWVTEAVNYRQWDGRNPGRHHDEGDRVVVVEDRDGDGTAETSTVFAQDSDLVSPLGICWLPDKVLVSCSPTVWAYHDDDGDLRADRKEVFLTGFGGFNHDHGAHSFTFGPDGRLYMALGNAGPHVVTDKSGWTLRSGSIYDDGGPQRYGNKPGLVSDDGRMYVGGLILRCNTDGTGLSVMAHNFRNPYEVAVDAFGDVWTFDNDDDGNQCCRVCWVMEGGDYGYFSADGSRTWEADRRPGQSVQRAHWHQDDPGIVPTTLITGSGGPTGVCVYEGDALPEALRGALLCADAGRSAVFALRRVPRDAGFALLPLAAAAGGPLVPGAPEGSEPLTGLLVGKPAREGDERWHLFRPSDVCIAPDGSVLVADWFDPGVGGHRAQDAAAYGRLLRVTGSGSGSTWVAPAAERAADAAALASGCQSVRAQAMTALRASPASMSASMQQLLADPSSTTIERARVLFAVARLTADGTWPGWMSAEELGSSAEAAIDLGEAERSALARAHASLDLMPEPDDPAIGASSAFGVSRGLSKRLPSRGERGWDLEWLAADRLVLEAFGASIEEVHGAGGGASFSSLVDEPLAWSPVHAALAWRLHPEFLVPTFLARARSPTLDLDARMQSLDALAFCRSRGAAEAMLTLALVGPSDTREPAAWWVKHNDAAEWRGYDLVRHLESGRAYTDDDLRWRSGPVSRGMLPVDVEITGARRLWLVVSAADNGNGCDWADWLEPRLFMRDHDTGVTAPLGGPGAHTWVSASAEWGEVRFGHNCDGGPLSVDGQVFADGIGTHAHSEIEFDTLGWTGDLWFQATAAIDDGGTRQPGAPTKVEFLVYADRASEREARARAEDARLDVLLATLHDRTLDSDQRADAAGMLALDSQGGTRLLVEAAAGRLAALQPDDARPELLAVIAEDIFRNPDLGVRALASEYFQRPGGPSLPPISELAALPGDRRAGQSLFFGAARCDACHAVRGRGGDVGPELSAIRTKLGRAELLDAILNPSAAIGAGFESLTVSLKDGRVLAGLLLADGPTLLLKDGTGARHVVDAADVAERRASKLSLMPDDIARTLQPGQLADLCAFLQHDPDAPPTLGPPQRLWNGRDLDGWTALPDASAWSVRDADGALVLHCEGQPIGYIRTAHTFTNFELILDWRFPDPAHAGNSGVLLRVQPPDGVWPRSLEAQLNSGDAGDIWNIGDFGADLDPARTEGRRTVKLLPSSERPLGQWNTYRITLRDGDLTLEVNGQMQNRARWCEELPGSIALQSEGAPIEFRRVELREIAD